MSPVALIPVSIPVVPVFRELPRPVYRIFCKEMKKGLAIGLKCYKLPIMDKAGDYN